MSSSGMFTLLFHILLMCVTLTSATITCDPLPGLEGMHNCTLGNDTAGVLDKFPSDVRRTYTLYANNQKAIRDISSTAFDSFTNLVVLHLNDNSLQALSPEWFKKLEFISYVNFAGNFISEVHDGTFIQCKQIFTVDLSRNLIEDFSYPSDDFYRATVYLSKNPLERIEIGRVDTLYLDETNLTELHLQNHIKYLIASNSKIRRFSAPSSLQVLTLGGNNLINLNNISELINLRSLDLSGNNISTASPEVFLNLPRLDRLNLSQNSIRHLYYGLFVNQEDLRVLDLSENKISHFNMNHIRRTRVVEPFEDLYLHNNPINKITDDGTLLNDLSSFVFGGNSLDLDCQKLLELYTTYKSIEVPDYLKRFDVDNVGGIGCNDPDKL